jgi:hypothetical protein
MTPHHSVTNTLYVYTYETALRKQYCKEMELRMVSSGMLGRVALVRTDFSEELSSSFIRVTRIGEL